MKQNVGKYVIIDYHLDYKNCNGGRFVMESETDMELIKVSESVVCLQFKWSRRILRTDNNNENSIPMEERKQDMATWLEAKIQELDLNN